MSKAVEGLMKSQPLVMSLVERLEKTIGTGLMVREGTSIHLTQAGQEVFRVASKVFREMRETESLLAHISSGKGAQLRIGCPDTLEDCLVSHFISDFGKSYPGIRIIVNTGRDATMARSVEDGRNDLAVIRIRPANSRLKMKIIGEEPLLLVASPWSLHVPGDEISVHDLASVPFVPLKEGFALREVVLEYLRRFGVSPGGTLEASSVALLKEFVMRDNGVAFVERNMVRGELEEGLLKEVRVVEGPPVVTIAIGYPNRKAISPPAWAFLRFLKQSGKMTALAMDAISGGAQERYGARHDSLETDRFMVYHQGLGTPTAAGRKELTK